MEHAWRDAAIATGLISTVPTLVLPFIPERATKAGSGLQRILLCFAVGGMMGDVFLHLLPHLLTGEHGFWCEQPRQAYCYPSYKVCPPKQATS